MSGSIYHWGIPGMRWGVRRAQKRLERADRKWEKNNMKQSTMKKVYNKAADHMNNVELSRINNMPKYKDKDLTKDQKLMDSYTKELMTSFNRALTNAAREVIGVNPSGTRQVASVQGTSKGDMLFILEDVKHADGQTNILAKTNALGQVVSVEFVEDSELQHFGIPGMRWGIRKRVNSADHERVSGLRKKKVRELSNDELKALTTRMQLEKQLKDLSKGKETFGKKLVNDALSKFGTQFISDVINSTLNKLVKTAYEEYRKQKTNPL